MEDREEVYSIWVNWDKRIISFEKEEGFQELQYKTHDEMFRFAIRKGNEMFELLTLVLFVWLFVKVIGLTLRMTWGIAKITVSLLIGLALPVLFVTLILSAVSRCWFRLQ